MSDNTSRFTSSPMIMMLLIMLFFYWGVLTLMNDLLLPVFREEFQLNYFHATLVDFGFFISYLFFALPAVAALNRIGYKRSLLIGLSILASGAAITCLAIKYHNFTLSILSLFVLGVGVVVMQVSANPLMDQLGEKKMATSRLSLGHGFTALGYAITPIIVGAYMTMSGLKIFYASVVVVVLATIFLLAGVSFKWSPRIDIDQRCKRVSLQKAWLSPIFIGCVLGIFFYVGAEVSIGSLLVNFLELPQVVGFDQSTAARCLSLYWGGAMLGRFVGVRVLMHVRAAKVLLLHALLNIVLLMLAISMSGYTAMTCLIAMGLFNSIMFPVIFSLGLSCFASAHNKNWVSGSLSMATCGAALVPMAQGWLADCVGLQHSFSILLICYAYLVWLAIFIMRRRLRVDN
jgi:MFS transporter, FHS family, L-fucose permease